jgi:hypothetical protein
MGFTDREDRKQVRLTGFNNEPMARLAEQRLWQSGIPCITRSMRGGPGLWGSAYNLPHDIYVYESDHAQARELLELPEIVDGDSDTGQSRGLPAVWLAAVVVAIVLVLGVIVPWFSNLTG